MHSPEPDDPLPAMRLAALAFVTGGLTWMGLFVGAVVWLT